MKINKLLTIAFILLTLHVPVFAADRPVVSIVKGKDINTMAKKAVDLIGGIEGRVKKWDRVIIKVSLDEAKPSGSGLVTDVELVRAVIRMCKDAGARRIIVADGSIKANTWKAFEAAGYNKMAKEEGVVLKDLDGDYIWRAWLPDGDRYKKYSVATTVLNCEVFINMPVAKIEDKGSPSLALKNLLGIMCDKWTKKRLPKDDKLDELIVDMNLIRQSDLVIVDCLKLNGSIIAGNDAVSTDTIAMRDLRMDTSKVKYLKLAQEKGLGVSNPSDIEIRTDRI